MSTQHNQTPDMPTPENNAARLTAIIQAGTALSAAIHPATGYNPQAIGEAFADALMKDAEGRPLELDLAHECIALVLSAAMSRMNEHYETIAAAKTFAEVKLPSPSYPTSEDEDDDDERMQAREDESRRD